MSSLCFLGNDATPQTCTFRAGSSQLPSSCVHGVSISFNQDETPNCQRKSFGATVLTRKMRTLLPLKLSGSGSTMHFCMLESAWLGLTLQKGNVNKMLKHIPMTQSETGGCERLKASRFTQTICETPIAILGAMIKGRRWLLVSMI